MALKLVNTVLILFAAYMGLKQGWAMFSSKPEMLEMFGKWHFNKLAVAVLGMFTIISVPLMLLPKTFVWGNFLMAASIFLIICLHLQDKNIRGVLAELPFFALSLVIIYLQHPLSKTT